MNTEEIKDKDTQIAMNNLEDSENAEEACFIIHCLWDKAFSTGLEEGKKLKNGHDDIINLFGEKREKLGYNKACGDCLKEFADIEHLLCDCPYDQEDNSNHTDECEVTLFRQKIRKLQEGKKQVYKKSDTSYTYNKACEDIKLLNNKILGMVSANIINSEIRKLQEGKQ